MAEKRISRPLRKEDAYIPSECKMTVIRKTRQRLLVRLEQEGEIIEKA